MLYSNKLNKRFCLIIFLSFMFLLNSKFVLAVGTPTPWSPASYSVINDKKVYYYWGGWLGATPFFADSAEESADYLCDYGQGYGSLPVHSAYFSSTNRYSFKCTGYSGWRYTGLGGTTCELNEEILPSDLNPYVSLTPFICTEIFDDSDKDDGSLCGVGNPCSPSTGNKFQSETDFSTAGISFVRSYNSSNLADKSLGLGWRSNHQKFLLISSDSLTQISATGRGEPWLKINGVWQGDADSNLIITDNALGLQLTNANGSIENYNLEGQLLSIVDTNGHQTTYSYNTNQQLEEVENHYGQSVSFSYTNGNITTVTDSLGEVYTYEYDTNNNLISVIYPDTTPSDNTVNPRKTYHYENVDYPNHLTGITDENGIRYATYSYDANGKAITTEHATTTNSVGQEKFELDYQGAD